MKAIIIAGGLGTRLYKYTKDVPKGMLTFLGRSLLQHQVDCFRSCGISNIVIVRKHLADKISIKGVRYIDEDPALEGNMVRGLFHARGEFDDDIIMTYGDVIFEDKVIQVVINDPCSVGCVVDLDWRDYWIARSGSDKEDTESLVLEGKKIISLGVPDPDPEKIDGRYVGIVKFSKSAFSPLEVIFDRQKKLFWDKDEKWYRSKNFKRAYMTDFLQCLIDNAVPVEAIPISHGWLEFDTNEDYERAVKWAKEGTLHRFYRPSNASSSLF
ncbi:phosphocholine cytidylyltransferase family protein [Candidatus Woesearchaeota archaeon]|nr:phosphocholine cytidylyltransferase family protein [Candidatus Woesearchaeota archaeon]